jgi:signal transduction histidine kinase
VARQIVEGHGGRIAAGEHPGGGGGACFTIWLPAAASARAAA